MKKFIIIFFCFLFAACAVFAEGALESYYSALKDVQNKNSYFLKLQTKTSAMKYDYDVYVKKNKFKAIFYNDFGGIKQISTMLCDGNSVYSYVNGKEYAISIYKDDLDKTKLAILNPAISLFDFETNLIAIDYDTALEAKIINNNDNKNGFSCRLLQYGNNREVCVSNEYGIAVYEKYIDLIHKTEVINNVLSIKTDEIQDSFFELPKGMEIKTMDGIIKDIKKNTSRDDKVLNSNKTINFD